MILTTHAIVGAAAAAVFPQQPLVAFAAAFASHLAIDAIPHWDYDLLSLHEDPSNPMGTDMEVKGRAFLQDLSLIAGDAILGVLLSLVFFSATLFHAPPWLVVFCACAGILPDPLQFVYWKTRQYTQVLEPFQRFHVWLQEGRQLQTGPWIGLGWQCALIAATLVVLKLFLR